MNNNIKKIQIILFLLKIYSFINITIFNLIIKFLLFLPEHFYILLNTNIYIINNDSDSDSDSDFDSDSDSNSKNYIEYSNKNILPINTNKCIDIYNKIINNNLYSNYTDEYNIYDNILYNSYILSLFNNIKINKTYNIIYAELLTIYKDNTLVLYKNIEITKKIKILYNFYNYLNTNLFNQYFNNQHYLIIIYYSYYTNLTYYKIIDLQNNKDLLSNKILMFGNIKL